MRAPIRHARRVPKRVRPWAHAREFVRSAGVFALLIPFGVLAAVGIAWLLWFGHDEAAAHLSAVTR